MKRALLIVLTLVATLAFLGLGAWQVERRAWKLDLIARVERGLKASPAPVPPSAGWPQLDVKAQEYRRVFAIGTFLHDRETLVQALTERGAGFWVLTPLRTEDGLLLVNRGFVPADLRSPERRAEGQVKGLVRVTGLMRASEPKGGFLRSNDPAGKRWYSRDVAAIAAAQRLGRTAPFFIDADATPNPGGYPIGGLTMVKFRNSHLVYAITWFALAALSAAGLVLLLRRPRRT